MNPWTLVICGTGRKISEYRLEGYNDDQFA